MRPKPFREIVIAGSDAVFDRLFRKSASTVGFLTEADSDRYSEKDARLTRQVRAVGSALYDGKFRKQHLYVLDDWWPCRLRYVYTSLEAMRRPYFEALRNLLTGEYCEWSLQVTVCVDIMEGSTMVGSMVIWADKLLIDRKLYDACSQPLGLRSKTPAIVVRKVSEVDGRS